MIVGFIRARGYLFLGLLLLLTACETEKTQQTDLRIQQNLFLQSVNMVESAGEILQKPGLTQIDINEAMTQMDEGLAKAFHVDKDFLRKLDVRLPKAYETYFIAGVESYRLGVESADREKQVNGLDLLSRWGQFWLKEKKSINEKLLQLSEN